VATKRAKSSFRKTSALETKLDGLVQLLERSQGPPTPAASQVSVSEPLIPLLTPNDYPGEDEAELEQILETYRTKTAAQLPIVVLPEDITVKQMREKRPFLWLVIRSVCNKSLARQAALGVEVKQTLGREILVDGMKTLDLLLGLLVFICWNHYYIYSKPIVSTITHLAISLACDLGIIQPYPNDTSVVMLGLTARGCPRPTNFAPRTDWSMEERRAAIGLFMASSM
jgi:hypothetical protein